MSSTVQTSPTMSMCTSRFGDPRDNLRRSLRIVTWGWVFGAAWQAITTGAPLTIFAQSLHASPLQFGILTALPFLASILALPASLVIDGTGRRKGVFFIGQYLQRFMWFPIALVPIWMMKHHPSEAPAAVIVFLLLSLVMHSGQGVGGPAWVSWVADFVPVRIYGKYFSRRRQWSLASALPAALVAGVWLDRYTGHSDSAQLNGCAILFIIAAILGITDITFFLFLGETPRPRQSPRMLLRSFVRPLHNRQFLLFSTSVGVLMFALNLTGQFANLYLLDVVKVSTLGVQIMLFVAPLAAQLFALPVWGLASDRVGLRPLLSIAGLGLIPVGLAWMWITPGNQGLGYLLSLAGAALAVGVEVVNFNYVVKFAGEDHAAGGSYIAVNTVIMNILACLGGISAGVIAQLLKDWHGPTTHVLGRPGSYYDVLFIATAGVRLAAVVALVPLIHEPTAHSLLAACRFILAASVDTLHASWRWSTAWTGRGQRAVSAEVATRRAA